MNVMKYKELSTTYISTKQNNDNCCDDKNLLCGKNDNEEFRIIIKFSLDQLKKLFLIKNNVSKVELCLFLEDMKLEDYMDKYMINTGINLNDYNIENISFKNSPKIYQECNMYVLKKEFINQYINFDITHIVKLWTEEKLLNYGITLLGINDNGIVLFNKKQKEPYLKIFYNELSKDEEKLESIKHNSKNKCSIKPYGYFYNTNGKYAKYDNYNSIIWNKNKCSYKVAHTGDYSMLVIEEIGIYAIDYSIDIRSNCFTYMALIINGVELDESRINVGRMKHMSYGSIIVDIKQKNSVIQLVVKKVNMILATNGAAATIRIIKL